MFCLGVFGGFDALSDGLGRGSHRKVARDAEAKYAMALKNGAVSTACFEAGVAAGAHLSLQDEAQFRRWKAIENECRDKP